MEYLKHAAVCLGGRWSKQAEILCAELNREQILCTKYTERSLSEALVRDNGALSGRGLSEEPVQDNGLRVGRGLLEEPVQDNGLREGRGLPETPVQAGGELLRDSTVLITDSRRLLLQAGRAGIVCVGCAAPEEAFLDGAALVTDSPEELNGRLLEELLLRTTGRPVTIAGTERLLIREMAQEDAKRLYEISRQKGMERAVSGGWDDFFCPDHLAAYIRSVYRFYGYGLWSVLLSDGTLIGCCGFSERCAPENAEAAAQSPVILELQYMLDEAYRGRGFGTEMCAAALRYAAERTEWRTVYVRIRPENEASLRLAEKLGFGRSQTFAGCSLQGDFIMLEYTLCSDMI